MNIGPMCAAIAVFAGTAYAGPFDGANNPQTGLLTWSGYSNGSKAVAVWNPTVSTNAGQFTGIFQPFGETAGNFNFWCYEFSAYVAYDTTPYNRYFGLIGGPDEDNVTKNAVDLMALFDLYYNPIANFTSDFEMPTPVNATDSAALQLAIWDIKFDSDYTLNGGVFQATASAARTAANNLLAQVQTYDCANEATCSGWELYTFANVGSQDYLSARYVQIVHAEEPGQLALFGLCILGLAGIIRQTQRNGIKRTCKE